MIITAEITSLSLTAAALALLSGLVSFVSPCVLPLLPVYLSFISGVGVNELGGQRRRLLTASLHFVAGFSLVFVGMGAGAASIGQLLIAYREELRLAAGACIVCSGLGVAGVVGGPKATARFDVSRVRAGGAFLTGAALAVAWTPCVGYVLGAILTMAASGRSVVSGALLLLVYSLGLGIPFILAALAFDWTAARLSGIKRHYRAVQVGAGALLVVFGVLLMAGVLERLSRWLPAFSPGGL